MSEINPRFYFVSKEKATVPPAGLIEHIKDSWWLVHPEKGLTFFDKKIGSPQCNKNESLTRSWAAQHPWAVVEFIPSVFRSINPQDYC